ncbi:EAL domain-containing protein (plasmid) [Deinococcus sp. KNUC1210]|uniref:putative bifunctional diguanylate cyclase/phosphodiesterase n=1 Tax=Deinococcus sp. KNUC1210 TaxID=2917691 RepID=UPI001EF0AA99|nr:EAL domain-containing protein [Deinococcus sp. KNUC1210]ULH17791.1 EAL domain-containing protein [Deinococcus sp. KNUC1210]
MPPPAIELPFLVQLVSPFLVAVGFPEARIGSRADITDPAPMDLGLFGVPEVYVSGLQDAPLSVLKALGQLVATYLSWRDLQRDRDRLRDVYDRTFQFQGTVLPDGTLVDANETLLAFAGTRRANVLGRPVWDAPWWDGTAENIASVHAALRQAGSGTFFRQNLLMIGENSARARVDFSLTPILDEHGTIEMIALEGRDITEHLRTLTDVEVARAALETILENVQDGIVACDASGRLTVFNRTAREWHGEGPRDAQPTAWSQEYQLYDADGISLLPDERIPLFRALQGETVKNQEMVIRSDQSSARTVLASGGPLYSASGQPLGAVVAMHDVSERKLTEQRLRHDALHDRLTGLPNRAVLYSLLENCIERFGRDSSQAYALLFLDLDNFKNVNDAYGHVVGDRLLLEVSSRLNGAVRQTDTVARLGGDEFAVLLDNPCDAAKVMRIVARINEQMSTPFNLSGRDVYVTTSIGAVLADSKYSNVEEPLRDADIAMYQAKRAGKNGGQLFDRSMHESVLHRLNVERDLRAALVNGELVLHYQPVLRLADGCCMGFEALVRWQHPVRGLIGPLDFIGAAEESGLIAPLGLWVLREGSRQLRLWREHRELAHLSLAVNISGQQLRRNSPDQRLADFDFPPGLELEVTESALLDTPEAAETLDALARLGVPLSLDDFGTGFASLAAVQHSPITTLKLDRSFIAPLPSGVRQRAIVASIMTLATHLKLRVIAEGLETREQVEAVTEMGCLYGQGYLYSRPVPAAGALAYALAHAPGADEAADLSVRR